MAKPTISGGVWWFPTAEMIKAISAKLSWSWGFDVVVNFVTKDNFASTNVTMKGLKIFFRRSDQ